jgi:hypothetical protein
LVRTAALSLVGGCVLYNYCKGVEQNIRSLWELDMSTAMSNNLQAGMGTPSAAEAGRAKCSTGALHHAFQTGTVPIRAESRIAGSPFPITTMSRTAPPTTVALLPGLLLYIINSLEVVELSCVSIWAPSPPDPSFFFARLSFVLSHSPTAPS